jgi:hypothetical protein
LRKFIFLWHSFIFLWVVRVAHVFVFVFVLK